MIYATSDLHGYPLQAFQRFLGSVNFSDSDHLCIIGDVNDRNGDGGTAMYRWIMNEPGVTLIRGNHEQMLLDCRFIFEDGFELTNMEALNPEQERFIRRWLRNGCEVTIDSLLELKRKDPGELKKLLIFLESTPVYLEMTVGTNKFVLLHGGIPAFEESKPLYQYKAFDLVWTRPTIDAEYWKDRTVILGHTPTQYYGERGRMFRTDTWIDIDTGAGGGGHPMLLRLDDLKAFYVE